MQPRRRRAAEAPCPLAPLRRARWHLYAVPVAPLRRAEAPGGKGAAPRWHPATLSEVDDAKVERLFATAPQHELQLAERQ